MDSSRASVSQQFIDEYKLVESENANATTDELFEMTQKRLSENGINLR